VQNQQARAIAFGQMEASLLARGTAGRVQSGLDVGVAFRKAGDQWPEHLCILFVAEHSYVIVMP
jgi:integral membrane sensor domain MASE1